MSQLIGRELYSIDSCVFTPSSPLNPRVTGRGAALNTPLQVACPPPPPTPQYTRQPPPLPPSSLRADPPCHWLASKSRSTKRNCFGSSHVPNGSLSTLLSMSRKMASEIEKHCPSNCFHCFTLSALLTLPTLPTKRYICLHNIYILVCIFMPNRLWELYAVRADGMGHTP